MSSFPADQNLIQKVHQDKVYVIPQIFSHSLDSCRVIAIDYKVLKNGLDSEQIKFNSRIILIIDDQNQNIQLDHLSNFSIHKMSLLENFSMEDFYFQENNLNEDEQNSAYLKMAHELNQEYEFVKNDLINKLNETRIDLINSRQKILDVNNRSESMRKILFAISMETEIEQIELKLNELLPVSTKATWIKIVSDQNIAQFKKEINEQINTTYNFYKLNNIYLFFLKGDSKPFKKDDLNLFAKIKDVLEINIKREEHFTSLVLTEKIVRTAFENFTHPLAIIDQNYDVVQANSVFKKNQSSNNKCYEFLFNRSSPCSNCNCGQKFSHTDGSIIYDVDSHPIKSEYEKTNNWINLYRNQTEKNYFEQRLKQTAQLKELGLISSSIAHELNNPIGGILSYLQLILMDLPKSPTADEISIQTDIQKMIDTTLKMKKIIEDLLIFSRTPQNKKKDQYKVADLISESLSLQSFNSKMKKLKSLIILSTLTSNGFIKT